MKIFVTGLTSSKIGGMEYHNLGNYIIVEPFFEQLRKYFPEARITTSIQMSDEFNYRFNLKVYREKRFWSYGLNTGFSTIKDIVRLVLWKITGFKKLLNSPMLQAISESDLVIDFSGDIYGDNANWKKFLESNVRLLFAFVLKKKVAMVIGSPGPFSTLWRQWIAKRILPKLDLLTNREPLSTTLLAYIGIKGKRIYSVACPSILFKPCSIKEFPKNVDYFKLIEKKGSKLTIGFILSGWNMPTPPFDNWPREDWEFSPFIDLIDHIISTTEFQICLMSHQNSTTSTGKLVKGNDHRLINRLIDLLGNKFNNDKVFTLKHLYNASQSKALISTFDLLISGRIHGAVQGLSQSIPTLIIDYGHEPKAHKLQGFARLYGVDDYVADPTSSSDMIKKFQKLLIDQECMKIKLNNRRKLIKEDSLKNFQLIKYLIS